MEINDSALVGFFQHGVPRSNVLSGEEYVSTCPFCGKDKHFYINIKELLYSCKRCGKSGNYQSFIEETNQANQAYLKPEHVKALSADRGLPVEAFQDTGLGFDGQKFTIPVYDSSNKLIDLRCFKVGFKLLSTGKCQTGLYNAPQLAEPGEESVYLCDGEWDTLALQWLLKSTGRPGIVVGVPGANTFKDSWVELFTNRKVYVLYDHDKAGVDGELKVYRSLNDVAKDLRFIHWPDSRKEGYDIRDFVSFLAIKKKKPIKCFKLIHELCQPVPRALINQTIMEDGKLVLNTKGKHERLDPISFPELVKEFTQPFFMPDITPIKVAMATVFANRLDGDMLWMLLVGAPSSLKTEIIQSFRLCPEVELLTSFSNNAFVSGYQNTGQKDKKDYSILKFLDGRILAIKDFTTILSMIPAKRDELFGQFRDIYDGETSKAYGNGMKHYKTKFGLLAGVTPSIERIAGLQQTLGERFLRYNMPVFKTDADEMKMLSYATGNVGKEKKFRDHLATCVKRFIGTHKYDIPTIPDAMREQLHYLSRFAASMRGSVDRDYSRDVLYTPRAEGPGRIAKQLTQMLVGLAILENKSEVTYEEFEIVRHIAVSTIPNRVDSIVRAMHSMNGTPMKILTLLPKMTFPYQTVRRVLEDLTMLHLVTVNTSSGGYYSLTEHAKDLINKSRVYPDIDHSKTVVAVPRKKLTLVLKRP